MAADELHRRVQIGRLLPKNRTGKHRMVAAVRPDVNLNGQLVLGQNVSHLSLLHHLDDVDQRRQGLATSSDPKQNIFDFRLCGADFIQQKITRCLRDV